MTVKELKNALLQEAVQGKLVPQIASEGNAWDLLEEIQKEKLSHGLDLRLEASLAINAKSGKRKSKKETALAGSNPCDIKEEMPFEIPASWCWCRLGEIVPFGTCKNAEPNEIEEEDWILDLEDIEKDSGKILAFKTKKQIDVKSTKHVFIKGNVLYSKLRPYLNKCVIAPKNGFCTSEILPLDFGEHIYNKYAQLYLMSPFFVDYTNSLSFGVKMPRLGTEDGKKALFPLPPLAEQKRIVAAIEKFMPLIEEYGKKETQLKAINEKIGTLTKKAILQEAVQGKLVPQIASEGNARDLLEEIRKERLSHGCANSYGICGEKGKKSKTSDLRSKSQISVTKKELPEITEDEIPFEIPENWCWCRLGEICNEIKRGKSPKYADKSNFLAFAQKCNVKTGGIDLSLALYLDENSITRYSETDNLVQGDIVINSTGGGTMGRVGLYETKVPAGIKGVYPDSHVTVIRSIGNINQHYLYYVLKLNQPVLEKCGTGSTNQTELKPAVLADFVIPLPPLAEQKRIVAAIEKMLPLCERLGI